ncbi:MFS transporter [Rhodococcus sp. NPDC055024]
MSSSRTLAPGLRTIIATAFAITLLDGFDLLMFGAVLPVLLESGEWGMTTVEAGFIGSLSLIGMMFGALLAGYVTDIVGRRPVILSCVVAFSIFTGLCAFAPNMEVFAVLRLLAGLGFGGALPTVMALTMEYVRQDRRQFYNGIVSAGLGIGGALIALVSIPVLPAFGWRPLFGFAGLFGVVLLAVAWRFIPESMSFLRSRGRNDEVDRLAAQYDVVAHSESAIALAAADQDPGGRTRGSSLKELLSPGYRMATILFPLIAFCGLLTSYGLQTWAPQILRNSGYNLGSSLSFLVAMNLGGAVGMLALNYTADRLGPRRVIAVGFTLLAVSVAILAVRPPQAVVFSLMILVGFCIATVSVVFSFTGVYYPPAIRGTGLGICMGLGRLGGILGPILVGMIVASSMGSTGVFVLFGVFGVIGAVIVAIVPRSPVTTQASAVATSGQKPQLATENT